MYPDKFLLPLYRNILHLSLGRGEQTLAKIDALIFNLQRKTVIHCNKNISILLPPDPHFFRYLIKSHEQHVSNAISNLAKDGDVVVDVGANIGYFSAYAAAAVGKFGQVFCLEPEAKNFEYLKANCDLIQRSGFNCSAFQLAASSVSGQATLNIHRYSTYHAIEDEQHNLDKVENKQLIKTVTLDEWSQSQALTNISLLKIDTEGHEPKVLEGARQLFEARAIDFVILECRSDYLANFIDEFCKEFSLNQLVWDGQDWHQTTLQSLAYKTECLLSKEPISPTLLC
ncbi:MAG: FkbM family methyltransferase [Symploca sp. SIO2E9]|nr:FkbM family methyltransferase [Symploca sp. SIO2E9]